jgi:hypothetical protein
MARKNVLLGAVVSLVVIFILIAVVRIVFPSMLDGFTDVGCYGVKCEEGQFCQDKVCRDINPKYTNKYYDVGAESFKVKEDKPKTH